MGWPIYYKERIWLVNPEEGDVGVITLWTPKEKFAELIDDNLRKRVSAVGQLYTKRGAEYIFRNIWANPKIRYLIIVGKDDSGSSQPFLNEKDLEKILDGIKKKYITIFFKNVKIIDLRTKSFKEAVNFIQKLPCKKPFAKKPKLFPKEKAMEKVFPSENSVFKVETETIGEAWLQILQLVTKFGKKVPRIYLHGGWEKTLLNLAVVINNEDISKPKIYPFFDFDKNLLKNYFKNFFTLGRGDEVYTYGERLFSYEIDGKIIDQVSKMTKKLQTFPYNKGALAILWQPAIDNFPIRKPWRTPCLTLVQGFCLEEKFFLTAYFRANDMFAAWPQNAFALRKLQTEIAKKLGKKVGDLTTISHSAFIDEKDIARAEKTVSESKRLFCRPDPRGYLVVETQKDEIIVRHFSEKGKFLNEYRQNGKTKKAALKLQQKLLIDNVISRIDHALDIGEQLGRAEDAIKLGLKFEQDKELVVK